MVAFNPIGVIIAGVVLGLLNMHLWNVFTAKEYGRNPWLWFAVSFFVSPWIAAIILLVKEETPERKEQLASMPASGPERALKKRRDAIRRELGISAILLTLIAVAVQIASIVSH